MAVVGKRSSQGLDPNLATRSGLESVLRLPSFTDSSTDDNFIAEEDSGVNRPFAKLKRDHWVEHRLRSNCRGCLKGFGLTSKKFNCRKCGEIFCEKCCQYRRRLSPDAQPSPNGHYYRVCFNCSDIAVQSFGETRSLTDFFKRARDNRRINVRKELCRLVEGFKVNVKASRLNSVMTETFSNIKVPMWQRSYKWLESKEIDWCSKCTGKFTMFMQKHHCRICGSVFCYKCCNQDLMLYYDENSTAEWALIRVVGCPDSEPIVCLYLTVCMLCHEDVESLQVNMFYTSKAGSSITEEGFKTLSAVVEKLRSCQNNIKGDLLSYQEMVEDLVNGRDKLNEMTNSGKSVVHRFAKLQTDLSDLFSRHASLIGELKKFKILSAKERQLLNNIKSTFTSFYNINMANFKVFKDTLSKTIPPSAVAILQNYCDKQAINCLVITTRRLGLEVLNICSNYSLEPTVAMKVRELDDVCLEELKSFIDMLGEDWVEHRRILEDLVKDMFKSKKMVVPSQSSISDKGTAYIQPFVSERSKEVLRQAQMQMQGKASETKFVKSKQALQDLIDWL